jgi:uncharacterized protein (TIRG00374 family)
MSRKLQAALFVLGAAVFAYLIARIGVGRLADDAAHTGWMFIPIVAVYGFVYASSAAAWRLTMAGDPKRPSLWRTYAILVSAGAINVLTPFINMGGEPYRIAALTPWLGTQRAAGSVVLHRMLNLLGYVLVWLTALGLGFVLLPRATRPTVLLILAAAVLVGVIALLLFGYRSGVLEHILNGMQRIPLIRRLAALIEPRRTVLAKVDHQIKEFYNSHPRRFIQAVSLEYLSRCIFMVELVLIAASLGVRLGYLRAFAIGGLEALLGNVLFFIPFELGAREGAYFLLFRLFGYDPQLGLYVSIVSRVRDFTWIAAGLLLIWVSRPAHQVRRPA